MIFNRKYEFYYSITVLLGVGNDWYLQNKSNWLFSRNLFAFLILSMLGYSAKYNKIVILRALFGFLANYTFSMAISILKLVEITAYYYLIPIFDLFLNWIVGEKFNGKKIWTILICLFVLIWLLPTFNIFMLLACLFWSCGDLCIRYSTCTPGQDIYTFSFINCLVSLLIDNPIIDYGILPIAINDLLVQYLLFIVFTNRSFWQLLPVRLLDLFLSYLLQK